MNEKLAKELVNQMTPDVITYMTFLVEEYDALNKGIDELIKKYEEMSVHDYTFIKNILQDLKKLKGE